MEKEKTNIFLKIKDVFNKLSHFYNDLFSSWKKTFFLLLIILTIVSATILCIFNFGPNTFYNCNSDDIVQYYPFVDGFFKKIREGNFSLYDTTLFGGVSIFANTYYIPIDIFLFIAFIFSFFMEVEFAYWFSLIVKTCCGALIFFYFLKRKNISKRSALLSSLIFASCGMLECFVIFPVYLGILVYAPLGMVIVDYYFDKKKKYLALIILPIYVTQIVLFDYYIAYMLLAFVSVFYLIESSFNQSLKKKEFYIDFIIFFAYLLLGVLMSLSILIPSALYVMNQSNRTGVSFDFPWYFTISPHKSVSNGISWRHYFTQLVNLFIPNNPPEVCLVKAGDYVREHASLYMTSGALIFFVNFFTLKGKNNAKLKIWVAILNIMFMIPLFCFIFSLQKVAYVRWFFIPYIINLYATSIGMSEENNVLKNKWANILSILTLVLGIFLLVFIISTNTELFMHYDKNESREYKRLFFYGITIGSLVFVSIYLLAIVYLNVAKTLKPEKEFNFHFMHKIIGAEMIFALVICLINIGSTSYSRTYTYRAGMLVDYLKKNSSYDKSQMERINLYTDEKFQANANTMYHDVNPYNFFQSFYNTPLNVYQNQIHNDSTTSWSRRNMYGYSLVNGPMLNVSHVISIGGIGAYITSSTEQDAVQPLYLSSNYYNLMKDTTLKKYNNNSTYYYYSLNESYPFIIYDKVAYKPKSYIANNNSFYNDLALLKYGYIALPDKVYYQEGVIINSLTDIVENISKYSRLENNDYEMLNEAKKIYDSNISSYKMTDIYNEITSSNITSVTLRNATYLSSGYFEYDLNDLSTSMYEKFINSSIVDIVPNNKELVELTYSPSSRQFMYLRDSETKKLYPAHYNMFYLKELGIKPDRLYVKAKAQTNSKIVNLYCSDYQLYDDYLVRQRSYNNRSFNFDNSNIHFTFENSDLEAKVVKLPLTYSKEWAIKNNNYNYQTVNINGGFLGVIIPKNIKDVDITLSFTPDGYTKSEKIAILGSVVYFFITSATLLYETNKYKKEIDLWKESR